MRIHVNVACFFLCKLHKVRNLGLQSNSVFLFSVFSVLGFNIKMESKRVFNEMNKTYNLINILKCNKKEI